MSQAPVTPKSEPKFTHSAPLSTDTGALLVINIPLKSPAVVPKTYERFAGMVIVVAEVDESADGAELKFAIGLNETVAGVLPATIETICAPTDAGVYKVRYLVPQVAVG